VADIVGEFVSRIAHSRDDRLKAFRLRYEVYIAEQGKSYSQADTANRTLTDELDADAHVVIVTDRSAAVVGTVRINWMNSIPTFSRYEDELELSKFSHINRATMAVCSRLAASMAHRHSHVRALLFVAAYEAGLERGTMLCFATCAPRLLPLFTRYGFREYAVPVRDTIVGMLHRTVLVLNDLEHLASVNSPFAVIARRRGVVPASQSWVARLFAAEVVEESEAAV